MVDFQIEEHSVSLKSSQVLKYIVAWAKELEWAQAKHWNNLKSEWLPYNIESSQSYRSLQLFSHILYIQLCIYTCVSFWVEYSL